MIKKPQNTLRIDCAAYSVCGNQISLIGSDQQFNDPPEGLT
jgi:hypothetical protein